MARLQSALLAGLVSLFWITTACTSARLVVTKNIPFAQAEGPQGTDQQLDIYAPRDAQDQPVVILLHGGSGSKDDPDFVEMSERLASAGMVVFNVTYLPAAMTPDTLTLSDGRALRAAYENVICAIRFANATAAEYGGDSARIIVLGQSAGGLVGLVSALAGEDLALAWDLFAAGRGGPDKQTTCTTADAAAKVDGFVGFNGAYYVFDSLTLLDSDVELKALTAPDLFVGGNPDLKIRFIFGSRDPTQPDWHIQRSAQLITELNARGYDAEAATVDAAHGCNFEDPAWEQTLNIITAVIEP